jgi:hypothetical protein
MVGEKMAELATVDWSSFSPFGWVEIGPMEKDMGEAFMHVVYTAHYIESPGARAGFGAARIWMVLNKPTALMVSEQSPYCFRVQMPLNEDGKMIIPELEKSLQSFKIPYVWNDEKRVFSWSPPEEAKELVKDPDPEVWGFLQ